jgi:hypothetical protein
MSPKYIEEQLRDPSRDPRHYDQMGRLDPKWPRNPTPPEIRMPGAGNWVMRSIYPILTGDAKKTVTIATAIAAFVGGLYLGIRIGHAEGFIEGSAVCRPKGN